MEIVLGMVVKSIAGHDAGRFYLVVKIDRKFAYISDGKARKIEAPKKKNFIHLQRTSKVVEVGKFKTNRSLRALLHDYNYE